MSIYLNSQKIIKNWIDYNDHMNVSYYLLIFDKFGVDKLNDIYKKWENNLQKLLGKAQ
jgi:acyl-CoA thioester hydrolase